MSEFHPLIRLLVIVTGAALVGCGGDGGPMNAGGTGGGIDGGVITADAGADQEVAEGAIVSIEGMGTADTFSWAQLSGPTVALDGADQAVVSFAAPWIVEESATIELELTVTEGARSATDTVAVMITNTHFILFLADKDQAGRVELYRVPLEGESDPVRLSKTPAPGGNVSSFVTSPDGRYVAYHGDIEQDNVEEIFVVASVGGDSTKLNGRLIAGGDVASDFAWSLDGSRIA